MQSNRAAPGRRAQLAGEPEAMNHLAGLWRRLNLLALAAVCWTALHTVAWAQAAGGGVKEGGGGGPAYLAPYALVVLCIGLGMLFVCRSARRRLRARPEEYKSAGLIGSDDEEAEGAASGEYQPPGMRAAARRASQECKEAKSALTYAIVGIFCFGIILEPIAFFKALQAKKLIKEDPRLTGDGKATAALIISIVSLVLWIVSIVAQVVMMSSAGG